MNYDVGSQDLAPKPLDARASIVGDKLLVAGRLYSVQHEAGDHQEILKRTLARVTQYSQGEFEAKFSRLPKSHISVQFTTMGARVTKKGLNEVTLQVELPQTPQRNTQEYWVKTLSRVLENKKYSSDAVKETIGLIFNEAHLALLDIMEGRPPSDWGEKTISDILQEPGNEMLRTALLEVESTYVGGINSDAKSCFEDLKVFILSNITRSSHALQLTAQYEMRQNFVRGNPHLHEKIEQGLTVTQGDIGTKDKGFPSEADKGEFRTAIIDNNTNLGTIATIGPHGIPEKIVAIRSGKSDTFNRLKENVLHACVEQLFCKNPKGLTKTGLRSYEFQHAITSYLDPSSLKAAAETATAGTSERQYLKTLLTEVDKWPLDGIYVTIQDASGQELKITLKKPIISSQLFSATVRGVGTKDKRIASLGQIESDNINTLANLTLLQKYVDFDSPISVALKRLLEVAHSSSVNKLFDNEKLFRSPQCLSDFRTIRDFLLRKTISDENPLLAKAFFVMLFRQAPGSDLLATSEYMPSFDNEMHAADIEIMRNIVLNKLNISIAKQCKSGVDRTSIGVALASAQEQFEVSFGYTFDPLNHAERDLLFFKKFYRDALKELGSSVVCETKGYSGLKWGGGVAIMGGVANPNSYKYLYLEDDIEQLHALKIDSLAKADVEGLTNKDLKAHGNLQYKGTLKDIRAVHGKSDKRFAKELKSLQKEIPIETRKEVIQEVTNFLIKGFGLKNTLEGKSIINDNLQLLVHVRDLELNSPVSPGATKTRTTILQAKIEELTSGQNSIKDNLELYILRQINTLWDLIERADMVDTSYDRHFFGTRENPENPAPPLSSPRSDLEVE
ncbi:MAG: hypothetical protein LLF94_09860 [Chlamydiales bacterium]|nr:hypothetical protein [Chlamydiales bacterium]